MSDERVTVRLQLKDAARFIAETKAAGHEIEVLGDKTERAGKKAKPFASELDRINGITKAMRWPVAIASVALLGQALSAGGAGAVAFTAALVPLLGFIGTLPALGALAGQGLGVLALGLMGVKDAVGGLNSQIDAKKFAELSEPAQDFVLALDGMKTPLRDLQRSVQGAMLPGFTRGLKAALPALTALQGPLTGTGRIIGSLGERLGRLVGSQGFLADLKTQAQFNNVQINRLGGAGLHLVNIFRNLMVASRPLVSWMVRLVTGWAAAADRATELGRNSGRLERMFHSVQVTASRVGRIVSDLAVAFFNVGKIGKRALGDELLVNLVKGSDALRVWTQSGDGVTKITAFFVDAKPVIYAVAHLLGDVATQLLRFNGGSNGGLLSIIGTLDSMVSVVGTLSDLVGPSTVIYAFLAMKTIGTAFKLLQIAKGIEAITATTTILGGAKATETVAGATTAGASAGRAYGFAFRAAAAIAIGVFLENEAKKHPAIAQYSGKKGWGELWRDSKHDVSRVTGAVGNAAGSVVHSLTPHLPGRAMGGPVWPGDWVVGERGREVLSLQPDGSGWVTPNHKLGAGPISAPVARAPRAAGGGGQSMRDHIVVEVHPQPVLFDGYKVADITADVTVKHAARA